MTVNKAKKTTKTMPELAASITIEDFNSFFKMLEATSEKVACPVCGSRDWTAPASHEDKSKPMIVTLPIPQLKGKGIWHYSLICGNCAYTMFFNSGMVVRKLQDTGKI